MPHQMCKTPSLPTRTPRERGDQNQVQQVLVAGRGALYETALHSAALRFGPPALQRQLTIQALRSAAPREPR